MPFPWKKNRVTRISRIVADLQSPKHGGSLVVETGFPTSLIDLFVKNRSRFTKPNNSKSKKPLQPQFSDPPPPTISPASPPSTVTSVSSDSTVVLAEAPSLTPSATANVNGGDDGGVEGSGPGPGPGPGHVVNRVGECDCGSGSKSVLVAFLKMIVVVVLIAGVEKLTVGITMSAFALLFLEYAGERFFSCLRPCSDANMRIIEPLTRRVSNCAWFFRKLRLMKTERDCVGSDSEEVDVVEGENVVVSELAVGRDERSSNSLSFDEIEVVETKREVGACREEKCLVVGPGLLDCGINEDKKLGCPQMLEGSNGKVLDSCEISQCESKGNVRFKSMMIKKLVPKKLRTFKKEKREIKSQESEAESPCCGKEGISTADEQRDVGKDEELECIREDGVDHGITCLAKVGEVAVISDNNRIDRAANSGYIIILFVMIPLAGLVVGRLPALILTMTWCVLLKIVAAQGKSEKVPRSNVLFQNHDRTLEGFR